MKKYYYGILIWTCLLGVCQGSFSGIPLLVGDKKIFVEVAKSWKEKKKGLQQRKELRKDQGMLFVYRIPQILSFWMKDTWIPLSIGFISGEGVLMQIEDMTPLNENPVKSRDKCLYALEMEKGWFESQGMKPGTKIIFPENWNAGTVD